ncbi:unnamed protein product [Durusdinium trenchii]|uniref:Ion transport domain-containing protein n=1 Tax=Durusdinium trenchii TaxID=1381693 RepID=A0ABP0RRN5_9DINO
MSEQLNSAIWIYHLLEPVRKVVNLPLAMEVNNARELCDLRSFLESRFSQQEKLLQSMNEKLRPEKPDRPDRLLVNPITRDRSRSGTSNSPSGTPRGRSDLKALSKTMSAVFSSAPTTQPPTVPLERVMWESARPVREASKDTPPNQRPPRTSRLSLSSAASRFSVVSEVSLINESTKEMKRKARRTEKRLRESRKESTSDPSTETQMNRLHFHLEALVFSPWFSPLITLLILVNVILLGIEVDVSAITTLEDMPTWFGTANAIFVAIFVLEILLKLIVLGCKDFWCGEDRMWNAFDFGIVAISVADVILELLTQILSSSMGTGQLRLLRSIRLARALRSIRVVRLFRQVEALRTLILSIVSTMGSLFWTMAMLILLFYSFGVVFTQFMVEHCRSPTETGELPECPELLRRYWSSVPESTLEALI